MSFKLKPVDSILGRCEPQGEVVVFEGLNRRYISEGRTTGGIETLVTSVSGWLCFWGVFVFGFNTQYKTVLKKELNSHSKKGAR
jgi:hypothetical protein